MKTDTLPAFPALFPRALSTLTLFLLLALRLCGAAHATTVTVAVNLPATVSADIAAGATSADLPFSISGADRLAFDLIVPIDRAQLSLIDPSGAVVMAPGDPRLSFHAGSTQTPPLPGGVYSASELAAPADGVWIMRLTFPAAPVKTALLGTVLAHSRYQAGIAIDRSTLLVGEDASIGMLVLDDGKPITGLAPRISVGADAPGIVAVDDGQGADGLANDGVYSIDHTFAAPGTYDVSGTVVIPTSAGPIQRNATVRVQAIAPLLNATSVQLSTQPEASGCVKTLQVAAQFNVLTAGRYTTLVRLSAPNGKTLDWRHPADLRAGASAIQASFAADDIRTELGSDGPYRVTRIDTLLVAPNDLTLAFRKLDAGQFNLNLGNLCQPAIVLNGVMTAAPVLRDGYIESLDLAFPVHVAAAGYYQISFKLLGAANQDIQLVNASRALAAGDNQVLVNVTSPRLQGIDGPYHAISLLVTTGSASARRADMGTTDAYARWQFYPARAGDLDNDGVVGPKDQAILAGYRGLPALSPGDRRDINRDGVIDLLDARALQKLR